MIAAIVVVGSCVAAAFLYWAPRRDQIRRAERQATVLRVHLATARKQLATAQRDRTAAQAKAVHLGDQLDATRKPTLQPPSHGDAEITALARACGVLNTRGAGQ